MSSTETPDAPTPIDELCKRLEIEALDRDLFLADPGSGKGRLFGGPGGRSPRGKK